MEAHKDNEDQDIEQPMWVGAVKALLLLVMVGAFFLLGQSMVRHHFFTGGELNNRAAAVGP
jgi:hypothetical protein